MNIPCDCILISGKNVTCNESELTGEPDHKNKRPLPLDLDDFDSYKP